MTDKGELVAGRYRLVGRIGRGAMGVVWRAHDERLDRTVAVKLLSFETALGGTEGDLAEQRVMREARLAAKLQHPNAIAVHDVVEHEGRPCLVMEYLPSESLSAVLADRGALPADQVARIGAVIADALAAAHAAGVVHRDIKPANLIVCTADPGLRVLDFGLSKLLHPDTTAAGLTLPHLLVGTPRYMSPEQVQDPAAVGAPSDIYSLGLVLYELVAGRSPYTATTPAEYCIAHVQATPAPLDADVHAPLSALILRCLDKQTAARPTAAALAADLHALADLLAAPPMTELAHREIDAATGATATALSSS